MKDKKLEVKCIDWFDDHFYKIRYENEAKQEVTEYFPSVTTKLGALSKPFLARWYGDLGTREAERRKNEQAERGSRIHHAWYTLTTGGIVIYNPPKTPIYTDDEIKEWKERFNNRYIMIDNQDEMYQVTKMKAFFDALTPEVIGSEVEVFDIKKKDAGTADNIFKVKEGKYEINGSKPLKLPEGVVVVDLKTGNSIGKEAKMQVSAYVKCLESMDYLKEMEIEGEFVGALIVHTNAKTRSGIEGLSVTYLDIDEVEQEYSDYRDIARVWERNFGGRKPVIRQLPGVVYNG